MHATTNITTTATFVATTTTVTTLLQLVTSIAISCKAKSIKMKRASKGGQRAHRRYFWNGLPYQGETSGAS